MLLSAVLEAPVAPEAEPAQMAWYWAKIESAVALSSTLLCMKAFVLDFRMFEPTESCFLGMSSPSGAIKAPPMSHVWRVLGPFV